MITISYMVTDTNLQYIRLFFLGDGFIKNAKRMNLRRCFNYRNCEKKIGQVFHNITRSKEERMSRIFRKLALFAIVGLLTQIPLTSWSKEMSKPTPESFRSWEVKAVPKPDLVITKITYSNSHPKQYDKIKQYVYIKNIGPGPSKSCYLRYKYGPIYQNKGRCEHSSNRAFYLCRSKFKVESEKC